MLISTVSAICLAIMATIVIYFFVNLIRFDRADRIDFIKSFKKGKCTVIYLVAIPLYTMAALYAGKNVSAAIFESITKSVYLIGLKYDVSIALIQDNILFAVAIYTCFSLVILNAIIFVISVLHQRIWEVYILRKFSRNHGNKCMLLGINEQSKYIYHSCKHSCIMMDSLSKEEREKLYQSGIAYKSFSETSLLWAWIEKEVVRRSEKMQGTKNKLNIIMNFDHEDANISLCGKFMDLINALDDEAVHYIDVYVFGDREHENIYSKYEKKSKGCLHYINEYNQIAIDFIDRYPLTKFMNASQIDYEESLIYPYIDINVCMIGFGRTNQQIFLSILSNNQFLTKDKHEHITPKSVSYHLFDKFHTENNRFMNHNYFRYEHDYAMKDGFQYNTDQYLPLPEFPEHHDYHYLDINDIRFYDDLKENIGSSTGALNYIIVALGDDYLNIDIANKIFSKLKEWDAVNCPVFVRIRDRKIANNFAIFWEKEECYAFGTEAEVVYDYPHIIQEKFANMAMMRNFVYDIEHDMKHNIVTEEEMHRSRTKWFVKRNSVERESNIYACLSLRSKLHLMGLDYCRKDENNAKEISFEEYLNIYAKYDAPDIEKNADGSPKAIRYSLNFPESRRKNMAIQEHNRWNAFMITKGFIPATKDLILNEKNADGSHSNGKNYEMRRHGNLTTFDGLVLFRKMITERNQNPEEDNDVIKYDYQLLDGAWWLLDKNGFKIIKKQ